MKTLCVYCGSSPGARPEYAAAARAVGHEVARRGWRLVYGGGSWGLMGTVAYAAMEAGADVIGVMPRSMTALEGACQCVGDLRIVGSMHERKATMVELSDAFLALPGGLGTFEELMEVATWGQIGQIDKPLGLLNVAGYYEPLLAMLDHAVAEGFLKPATRASLLVDGEVAPLLDRLAATRLAYVDKWKP